MGCTVSSAAPAATPIETDVDRECDALVETLLARHGEGSRAAVFRRLKHCAAALTLSEAETTTATAPPPDAIGLSDAEFDVLTAGEACLEEADLATMQGVDLLILDNSLRETTVATQYAHTIDTKLEIIAAFVEGQTKVHEVILGTYSAERRVDDVVPQHFEAHFGSLDSCWGLTDIWDCHNREALYTGAQTTTDGFEQIVNLGFRNCVLEIDTCLPTLDYTRFDINAHLVHFIREAKRRLHPRVPREDENAGTAPQPGRVLVNLRDFTNFATNAVGFRRALGVLKALAALPEADRPLGVIYEEPSGLVLPQTIGRLTRIMRKTMARFGWGSGRLLIHVHDGFGNADAGTLAAFANGCDGIWGALCHYGAQLGHASSTVAVTNLARLGNTIVRKKYNIPGMVTAARRIHELASTKPCDPLQEVYGTRAFDMVFGSGPMSYDNLMRDIGENICGQKCFVRVSEFASPEMMLEEMTTRFGPAEEAGWDPERIPTMCKCLKEGYLNRLRWNYNSDIGLATLYEMAGPHDSIVLDLPKSIVEQILGEYDSNVLLSSFKRQVSVRMAVEKLKTTPGHTAPYEPVSWVYVDPLPALADGPDLPTKLFSPELFQLMSVTDGIPIEQIAATMHELIPVEYRETTPFRTVAVRLAFTLAQHGPEMFSTLEELFLQAQRDMLLLKTIGKAGDIQFRSPRTVKRWLTLAPPQ